MIKENQQKPHHSSTTVIKYQDSDPWWFSVLLVVFTYLLLAFVLPDQLSKGDQDTAAFIDTVSRFALPIAMTWCIPSLVTRAKQLIISKRQFA
ncbi:hypothetical protein JCM19240_6548 [Vibrio maritimus]|uniref:Uncharacterized protein n=1 Tax=Vibrio maritimus TaxID=990268 RepID=A0A090SZM2_9VIBR|nr:hypothetical protein JCM19240_6548 [Vibrio maritimus]